MMFTGISTAVASGTGENLVIERIGMAFRTVEIGMFARCDGEIRVRELALIPALVGCLMTELTIGGETGCSMVWIQGALVITLMTGIAVLWRSLIDVVSMTGAAIQRGMSPKQRIQTVVVETGHSKARIGNPMTLLTDSGETGCSMVRIPGALVITLMTGIAEDRTAEEVTIYMTFFAGERSVSGVERHSGSCRMVESDGRPGYRIVAVFAFVSQLSAEGIVLAPDPMTVVTAVGRSLDFSLDMAGITCQGQVPALKREGP